jgi:GT2 family glycosyltransferase
MPHNHYYCRILFTRMQKQVAVILLNWNTPMHTVNCIASLQQYCNGQLFDIIVADNGSTDDSLSIIRKAYPDLLYIENKENLGFAEGNNRGLVYSIENAYTYSLVMNTDTLVDSDLVAGLTTHLDNHPQAAVVQPAIYWMHNRDSIWNGEGKFNTLLGLTYSDKTRPHPNDIQHKNAQWATGCCMLIRNVALLKSGLFNKQFFLYYEDVELSFKLRDNGYEIHYLPFCKMYHEAGASAIVEKREGIVSPVIHYYICRNHIWFLRRYGKPVFYPINVLYNGFYYLAVWAYFKLRGRNEKASFIIKALKEGLFTPKSTIWPQ